MKFRAALDEVVREAGLTALKPKQFEAIEGIISGEDVFVAVPTGYGKSIIYALLPSLYDKLLGKSIMPRSNEMKSNCSYSGTTGSIVVCICPLTAIMVDQQKKFVMKGIKAEFVGEAQTDQATISKVLKGDLQLLYISPESILNNKKYRMMLLSDNYAKNLKVLAIDEAHCIMTW